MERNEMKRRFTFIETFQSIWFCILGNNSLSFCTIGLHNVYLNYVNSVTIIIGINNFGPKQRLPLNS